MKGLFGDLFDFNHDGNMSDFERAAEMSFLHEMISEEKEYEETELELSGLDPDERREVLEDTGLDPDEYDF